MRDKRRRMIADELNFNKKVGDFGIGVPRSGKLTTINFNDWNSAEMFVHMLRQELTVQAEHMNSAAWDQARMNIREICFWNRWTKIWPMHEVSDEVKTLLKQIVIIAHFLRLFDFGYIEYEHRRQGSIWADKQLCCWMDISKLCIYMDKTMFSQCCQPQQTQHYKAVKWQTSKNSCPFNLFGGMADLRYNWLKML